MRALSITYDGDQHATALQKPQHNVLAIDCPYTGKGEEFSPANLLGISLASCMLLSMGAVAQRDHLNLKGTVVNIGLAGMDKTFPHVDSIKVVFHIPRDFSVTDREKLERAANLCPIMSSISADTAVSTTYKYAAAAI